MHTLPAVRRTPEWSRLVTSLGVALLLGAFVVDLFAPADLMIPVLFALALSLMSWSHNRGLIWGMAGLAVVLTVAVYLWGPPPRNPQPFPSAMLNRALCVVVIAGTAALARVRIQAEQMSYARSSMLDKQYSELEQLNEELSQREEEIVRQNEELQSQTEELERQSEELRVTNEELTRWEKTLEQLLQLSRTLTANLKADEIKSRICESLVLLFDGNPVVMLEKRGEELVVDCHHGFGPGGPRQKSLPLASSFAATVMSIGQTAYLEDLALRPELGVVHPARGGRFRSAVSSPVRLHGQPVGTIEVYASAPHGWSEAEISLVESLAAQASISLQAAEMVETIRYERRRFEAAFRNVPFGMMVAEDVRCEKVRLNPAAASMFNISVDENIAPNTLSGARILRYLRRDGHPISADRHPLLRAVAGEEIIGEDWQVIFPNGRRLELLASAAPVYSAQGEIEGAVCAFADVTGQKQLQREIDLRRREAEEASARKTRFLAAVSHDIRTPANAISLMAELIRRYAADPAMSGQIAGLVEDLQRNTLSLIELISDVLDLARFDTGKADLIETEFPLADLLDQEVRQHLPVAEQKGIGLEVEPVPRNLWLRTDRVKLARVIGNLIGNAIKFTQSGKVIVSTAVQTSGERAVSISVRDTGVGIPEEQMLWIFDEFRQLHNPERDRNKGSGLGLSISKRLVDLLGGTIEVTSRANEGSTFTVSLPASAMVLRLEPALRPANVDGPPRGDDRGGNYLGLRVLLVEDHDSTRDGTSRILRDEGADVVQACDGTTAIASLRSTPTDVLLLDMMLPDMDGREILRMIHQGELPAPRALFVLTGDLTEERRDEVKLLGADGLIEKPIDVKKLIAKLRELKH